MEGVCGSGTKDASNALEGIVLGHLCLFEEGFWAVFGGPNRVTVGEDGQDYGVENRTPVGKVEASDRVAKDVECSDGGLGMVCCCGLTNTKFFKKAAYLLRCRHAKTKFLWTKGHSSNKGNEESNRLAKEGASKQEEDELDLEIPMEFKSQGTKLATLTQVKAYQGIMEKMEVEQHCMARINLQLFFFFFFF
jgi:hypothetical protein